MNNKIIFIDYSIFLNRAIFSWRNNKQIPPEYTCLNMIFSNLRRIGVEPTDTVIFACDGGRSWRRDVDTDYKANRKAFRDSFEDINWTEMFARFDRLLEQLNKGTDWHIIRVNSIEADDIMAVGSRYFKDNDVILVTYDVDMEQLAIYDNVKIFSPLIKYKGGRGAYKLVKDPCKVLAKKIQCEKADNLTAPILTNADYEKRKSIVSLLELPIWVEESIIEEFKNLKEKEGYDSQYIPFLNIRTKIENLYNDKDKVVNYEECINKKEKTKKRRTK